MVSNTNSPLAVANSDPLEAAPWLRSENLEDNVAASARMYMQQQLNKYPYTPTGRGEEGSAPVEEQPSHAHSLLLTQRQPCCPVLARAPASLSLHQVFQFYCLHELHALLLELFQSVSLAHHLAPREASQLQCICTQELLAKRPIPWVGLLLICSRHTHSVLECSLAAVNRIRALERLMT
jgi:hypothetical protein